MSARIIQNDQEKNIAESEKKFESEHRYMDFSHTIIGEKVKIIDQLKSKDKLMRFDDIYYSKLILKCD